MEKQLSANISETRLRSLVSDARPGDILNTESTDQFEQLKRLLVEMKKVGLRICLLDEDGYILRQISSRQRDSGTDNGFNDQQKSVIKALERVLEACRKEGVTLVGYSDSLVALPTQLLQTDIASAEARELNSTGVYIGAEMLNP